ncbi:MAG: 1-(5-phosphoribosyl)-5-[(5-phosphoribosylamino)methylideneamino]imidazole-4-carboxamide isomerase, partial [Flavobacteriales bacterium]|jgi:phosphoribosylformimino-5-aminoimidazole carboxamide ribotide isomerase
VSNSTDLVNLATLGCHGAIVGKAIYEGRITLKEIENFIQNGY